MTYRDKKRGNGIEMLYSYKLKTVKNHDFFGFGAIRSNSERIRSTFLVSRYIGHYTPIPIVRASYKSYGNVSPMPTIIFSKFWQGYHRGKLYIIDENHYFPRFGADSEQIRSGFGAPQRTFEDPSYVNYSPKYRKENLENLKHLCHSTTFNKFSLNRQ